MDDMALLRQYAEHNSQSAFAELVSRRVNFVYSAALRQTRAPHLAEEITQAVFILLAQKAASIPDKTILTGWLFRTTRFTAIAQARSAARRWRREQEAHMRSQTQSTAPDPLWEQMSPLLDEALARLGEKDRQAVLLRFFEDKSMAEVGFSLGTNEDAARKRVSRALEKLRCFFLKRGVVSTTAIIAGAVSANSVQAAPVALAASVTSIAVAKGTAAGGSTFILIKGALKIMAWTKAKTAIVVGTGVVLVAGTATIAVNKLEAYREYSESWRVANLNSEILDQTPPQVRILPTRFSFPRNNLATNADRSKWGGIGVRLAEIVWAAYDWRPGRIVFDTPQPAARYDFISTLDESSGEALQQELKKELGFVAQKEMREMDVLVLKVRRANAPGLKPAISGGNDWMSAGRYYCDNRPISSAGNAAQGLTKFLEAYFGTPVVDETGLTQNFNIDLRWDAEGPRPETLKKAILDQLGLELASDRRSIEVLVVKNAS